MKQSSFDATISALDAETSALDVETSAFGAATSAIARRSFYATISTLDAETSSLDAETSSLDAEMSALGAATSTIARSYRRYRRGVSGDCGVGITPQMCNRVTNHGDMSTFSKPGLPVDGGGGTPRPVLLNGAKKSGRQGCLISFKLLYGLSEFRVSNEIHPF